MDPWAMSLQPLHQLDRLFAERLNELLCDEGYVEKLVGLQGDELVQLVNYLSDTAAYLIRTGGSPMRCLQVLYKISSTRKVLPSTCEASGRLSTPSGGPIISYGAQRGLLRHDTGVCIKKLRIHPNQEKIKELLCKEAVSWIHLDHPNIVPFRGVTLEPPQLVSEWMSGMELRMYVKGNPHAILGLLLGIGEGLAYLHSRDIIHGDLKGRNVIVDASGNARITNFGLASIIHDFSPTTGISNVPDSHRWTAPEILRNEAPFSNKSDVFSYAMVVFEAFSGTVPYSETLPQAVPEAIMKGDRPHRPTHPGPSDSLWKLVQGCWRDAAIDRPEIGVVVEEMKGMKIIPPAGMEPLSDIVRDEWGTRDALLRPNSYEGEEVNPYDVDTPLPNPAPVSPNLGGKPSPVPQEIGVNDEGIRALPPWSPLLNIGNNESSVVGSEVVVEDSRKKYVLAKKGSREGRGRKASEYVTQEGGPLDPYESTTSAHVRANDISSSMALPDIQRRLGRLNPEDNEHRLLLLELLRHRNLKPYIQGLQENNLQAFIDLLDRALNHMPITDDLFRKTLRRLQSACSNRGVLPSSYLISSEMISDRGELFASGGFANVHEAKFDGRKVCIKVLRTYSQDVGNDTKKAFYEEVVVWKRLQHPNIVPFLGVPTGTPSFEIVCDWMENGRITEYVAKFPQVDRISLLWDVADGLHYLHSSEIIHGDLKGANILIDKGGHACLSDFGLTSIVRRDTSLLSLQELSATNATAWAAPEILRGGGSTMEGDVFTFAMVAVETFTGRPPFSINYHSALLGIMNGIRPRRPEALSHDGLWEFIQGCWDQDPVKRPTAVGLVKFFEESFSGKRERSKPRVLQTAPSTWTLAGHKVHPIRNTNLRSGRSTGSSVMIRSESPTSMGRHDAPVANRSMPRGPSENSKERGESGPPHPRINSSPPVRPIGRFKKLMKRLSLF